MLGNIKTVLAVAFDRALVATASAEHAYGHFGQTFGTKEKCSHLLEGFCEGLALGLKQIRAHKAACDSSYVPHGSFKAEGGSLIIEVNMPTTNGDFTPVTSTLSYGEAMSLASGLNILRGTGLIALKLAQVEEVIRCADQLKAARHTAQNCTNTSRAATN